MSRPLAPSARAVRCSALALLLGGACADGAAEPAVALQFEGSRTQLSEGVFSAAVRVVLRTSLPSLSADARASVVVTSDGSATPLLDFEPLAESGVVFPAGSIDGDWLSIGIETLRDNGVEGAPETIELALVAPEGAALGARRRHTIEILDLERATLHFAESAQVTRSEATGPVTIPVQLELPPGTALLAPLSVRVSDSGLGSATRGIDYATFPARTLLVPAGTPSAGLVETSLTVLDDALSEGAETVILRLSLPAEGVLLGAETLHTLTIRDDEPGAGPLLSVLRDPGTGPSELPSGSTLDLGAAPFSFGSGPARTLRVSSHGSSRATLELPLVSGEHERDFALEFATAPSSPFALTNAELAALPSPLVERAAGGLALEGEWLDALAAHSHVRLLDVPLRGERVVLTMARLELPWSPDARVAIDGAQLEPAALLGGLSLWHGSVEGEPGSDVFLALSEQAARGWVRRPARPLLHLVGSAGPQARAFELLGEVELEALGARAPADFCLEPALTVGQGAARNAGAPSTPAALGPWPRCRVALESDFQLFQRFGDARELVEYVTALVGAVSARYQIDVGTALEIAYLGVHTTADDGWSTPESGGNVSALLDEFQRAWAPAWNGVPPAQAALHHFLSGAQLGGGVAYVGVLCDSNWGFAVSANLNGAIQWPGWSGEPTPLAWDFVVFAHETGHNFGALHTHSYCPPLDHCFASCDPASSCSQGTLMSYCHLCGGLDNMDLRLHPFIANAMRAQVSTSCLGELVLEPLESVEWTLRFAPVTGVGPRSAELSFEHDAGGSASPFSLLLRGSSLP